MRATTGRTSFHGDARTRVPAIEVTTAVLALRAPDPDGARLGEQAAIARRPAVPPPDRDGIREPPPLPAVGGRRPRRPGRRLRLRCPVGLATPWPEHHQPASRTLRSRSA